MPDAKVGDRVPVESVNPDKVATLLDHWAVKVIDEAPTVYVLPALTFVEPSFHPLNVKPSRVSPDPLATTKVAPSLTAAWVGAVPFPLFNA